MMDFNTFKERVQEEFPYLVSVIDWEWVKDLVSLDEEDYFSGPHSCYIWNNLFKNSTYKKEEDYQGTGYVYTPLDDDKFFFKIYSFGSCEICDTYSGLSDSSSVYNRLLIDLEDGQVLDETELGIQREKRERYWREFASAPSGYV